MSSKRYSGNWNQAVNRSSSGKYPSADPYPYGYANVDTAPHDPTTQFPVQAPGAGVGPSTAGQAAAGSSRSNSHKRRDTHGYQYPEPPLLGNDAGGSYAQRLQAQPGLEDQIYRSKAKRPDYDDPVSPASPAERVSHSRDLIEQKYGQGRRKGSVPDRSPLQKLEVTLDDISKEEKRARVAEQEEKAQRRASRHSRGASGSGLKAQGYVPGVIDPYERAQRASSNGKRVSSAPSSVPRTVQASNEPLNPAQGYVPLPAPPSAARDHSGPYQPQRPAQPVQPAQPPKPEPPRQYQGPTQARRSVSAGQPTAPPAIDTSRNGVQNYYTASRAQPARESLSATSDRGAASGATPAVAAGAATAATAAVASRSGSKKLQKPGPQGAARADMGQQGKTQLQNDRVGKASGATAARENLAPDPLPPQQVLNRQGTGPKYTVPPQTAAAHQVHNQLGFGQTMPSQYAPAEQEQAHHRFGGMFHHEHGPERRYQRSSPLDEWRSAQVASLMAEDLNLNSAAPGERGTAWWEKNEKGGRRGSGSKTVAFDGSAEETSGKQTYFQPPMYLKCGPLLRYCGIRKSQSSKGSVRETWRGTVLIVTDDTQSNTQTAPTLRLFAEPRDLIPPPPLELNVAEGQELAAEYVDPLAGQVHMSRIGKTLYVRPVEQLPEKEDLSRIENDNGLFEERRSAPPHQATIFNTQANAANAARTSNPNGPNGERLGKFREVKAIRLLSERNTTFWRFNIEVELGLKQARVAYRINNGPAVGFWVPARGETMNVMFHSCNGFSLSVHSDDFCGPDPMWRDVLNCHQTKPFHVMIGGGDQIYNDAATQQTELFREWCESRNPHHKHGTPFSVEMQNELEDFYLERYAMWFSQGLFGMANGQIPMVNMWDDHDIIDGFGSYPHHFMSSPVFCGVGAVAFKYYMLFQHQSLPSETSAEEPSWLLGASPGPYIEELSRSLFMSLGRRLSLLALDCRTERLKDEILSQASYDLVFERLRKELVPGETQHLLVLLGVPIAYPRLNFLENILTSRAMDPIKALGRLGLFGNLLNKFDGGVEILDDLDDHWTAKHHKDERNWFIQELQELAAERSVRITILGGDVHLAAVGQFYSNKKLGIPKDQDHRYMPNVISSAIVNTPPPELMGDIINKRNKIHHLDKETDEDMIPLFTHDVDGKPRNNHHLLPRRNWCAIREYAPGQTPPPTPPETPSIASESRVPQRRGSLVRSLSLGRKDFTDKVSRRLTRRGTGDKLPPRSFFNSNSNAGRPTSSGSQRRASDPSLSRAHDTSTSYFTGVPPGASSDPHPRPNPFHRVPTGLSEKAMLRGAAADADLDQHINLQHGLDIVLNMEVNQHDPAGITTPYRLLIPTLRYEGPGDVYDRPKKVGLFRGLSQRFTGRRGNDRDIGYDSEFDSDGEMTHGPGPQAAGQYAGPYAGQGQAPARVPVAAAPYSAQPAFQQPAPQATAGAPRPIFADYGRGDAPAARRTSQPAPPPAILHQQPQAARTNVLPSRPVAVNGAGMGPDGRPVRKQYRGDVYDDEVEPETYTRHNAVPAGHGPGGMADEGFSDEDELPRESLGRRLTTRIFGGRRN